MPRHGGTRLTGINLLLPQRVHAARMTASMLPTAASERRAAIDIRLPSMASWFDSLDPSPFRQKALDRNVEAYLFECAGEHSPNAPLVVRVHGPEEVARHRDELAASLHAHFELLHAQAQRRHRRRSRIGRIAILFGFLVLLGALLLRTLVADWSGAAGEVLEEGLLILAWVALWRPAEVALFDSWESRQERRLLATLARVPVEVSEVRVPLPG
jgi:hypothetical protein